MSSDLPGFYFDPEKKKYFAVTPGTSGSVFLSAGDARLKLAQQKAAVRAEACVCVPQRVQQQETAAKSSTGLTMREDFVRGRIKGLSYRKSFSVDLPDYQGNESDDFRCSFLIVEPDDDACYAIWTEATGTSVLARLSLMQIMRTVTTAPSTSRLRPLRPSILNCYPPASKITDVHSFSNDEMNFIICLSVHTELRSNRNSTSLSLQLQEQDVHRLHPSDPNHEPEVRPSLRDTETRMNFEFPGVYDSCAAAANRFAIGGQKHVKIFTSSSGRQNTIFQGFMNYESKSACSRVTALRFSTLGSSSDVILAATSNGFLHTYDLRTPAECSATRIARCTVNQMKQYQDYKWLVSGHENALTMVDQRFFKTPFLTFTGHANSCHKFAMCVNDTMRTVSLCGDDNVTRFWSLDSGNCCPTFPFPLMFWWTPSPRVTRGYCRIHCAVTRRASFRHITRS